MEHRTMDWHSWLSKSCLEPSLVYDYGLLFMNNELEEDDIAQFDHDFLQSMGVSIAKHRLEILKLAKNSRRGSPLPVAKLATVIRKSKTRLEKYIRTLARSDGPAILVVPKTACGDCWRGATSRRKTKLVILKQGTLMITDRGMRIADLPSRSHSGTPMGRSRRENRNAVAADGCWETADGATRWDSMFQNLKPT